MGALSRFFDLETRFFSHNLSPPAGVQPVTGFDGSRYLGRWYEIARLYHAFEKGLSQVTADYIARRDGSLEVHNKGYNAAKNRWYEARGIARFLIATNVGSLRVSFFRPIWGGYHIFALDRAHYRYAMVSGQTHSHLWILSREKSLEPEVLEALLEKARAAGFDTEKLMLVPQD